MSDRPGYEEWRATLPKALQYEGDYDLRGLYNRDGPVAYATGQHMTDAFKKPNHPTFSTESKYADAQNPGGTWKGNAYVPPSAKRRSSGNDEEAQRRYKNDLRLLDQQNRMWGFDSDGYPLPPEPPPPYQRGLLTSILPYEINEKEKKLDWAVPPLLTGLLNGLNPTKDVEETPSMFNPGRGILSGMLPEGKKWALPGMLSGALDSAQDPGRAARGEYVPEERGVEFGMNLLGGSALTNPKGLFKRPPSGQMNNFIGRAGYKNLVDSGEPVKADLKVWDTIQNNMDKLGRLPSKAERDLIFKKYNLSIGHGDGKVRYMTPVDQTFYLKSEGPKYPGDSKPFKNVVINPQFAKAHPELFDEGKVTMDLPNDEFGGSMASWRKEMTVNPKAVTDPSYDREYLDSLTSHELAHYPETLEGFAPGGSPDYAAGAKLNSELADQATYVKKQAVEAWLKVRKKMTIKEAKEYEAQYPGAEIDDTTRLIDHESLIAEIINDDYHPYHDQVIEAMTPKGVKKFNDRRAIGIMGEGFKDDAYYALGGEQNSNLVQAWKKMTPEQRDAAGAPTNLMYDEAVMPHRTSTGRKFVHPSNQIDLNKDPTGGTKLIVQKLREYAADPGGRKAQHAKDMALYAKHAEKYGYNDLPAAAKKFKLTPEEYTDFKGYVDKHLPKDLEPFRNYLEHAAMENGDDWFYQGRDFPGWPDTRMSTVKSTFQSLIDDPYAYLKEYGYPDPRDLDATQAYINLSKKK